MSENVQYDVVYDPVGKEGRELKGETKRIQMCLQQKTIQSLTSFVSVEGIGKPCQEHALAPDKDTILLFIWYFTQNLE